MSYISIRKNNIAKEAIKGAINSYNDALNSISQNENKRATEIASLINKEIDNLKDIYDRIGIINDDISYELDD